MSSAGGTGVTGGFLSLVGDEGGGGMDDRGLSIPFQSLKRF